MAPINFVLNNFETVINLDISGTMLGEIFTAIDASANAVIEIDLAVAKSAFQFQSDSSDVLNDVTSDIKFYLSETNFWNAGFKYNAADANVVAGGTPGPIASGFDLNKSMVCHDFVRYIAEQLFNTHHGVDLLDNELELLTDIRKKSRDVWTKMQTEVAKYKDIAGTGDGSLLLSTDSAGNSYSSDAHSESITRRLYEQMIYTLAGKERFKGPIITGVRQDLPFEVDDTIEIKLTINPESNQHTLTNVALPLGGRSYKIVYKLKASPAYPARDVNEGALYATRP